MKSILKSSAVTLLALALSTGFVNAKGKKPAPPPAKPKADPVEAYMKAHDKNKDGVIDSTEMSSSEIAKGDTNKDGKLDRNEVAAMLHKK
jgi:Ca2+-binding EF-hand superfamily protein